MVDSNDRARTNPLVRLVRNYYSRPATQLGVLTSKITWLSGLTNGGPSHAESVLALALAEVQDVVKKAEEKRNRNMYRKGVEKT